MLRVNLWQKLLRVRFEGNTVERAQKNQEMLGMQTEREGEVWEGDVVFQPGREGGSKQLIHSWKHEVQRPPYVGKKLDYLK